MRSPHPRTGKRPPRRCIATGLLIWSCSLVGCAAGPTLPEQTTRVEGRYRYDAQFLDGTRPLLTGWLTLTDQPDRTIRGVLRLSNACRPVPEQPPQDCVLPLEGRVVPGGSVEWQTVDGMRHAADRMPDGRLVGHWTISLGPDSLTGAARTLRGTFRASPQLSSP